MNNTLAKLKEKITLNPIMTFLILTLITILISGLLSWIGLEANYNKINANRLFLEDRFDKLTQSYSSRLDFESEDSIRYINIMNIEDFYQVIKWVRKQTYKKLYKRLTGIKV